MNGNAVKWAVVFLLGTGLLLLVPRAAAREGKAAEGGTGAPERAAVRPLVERLRALEAENRRLMEAAARLAAGRPVEPSEVLKDRLPPLPLPAGAGGPGGPEAITEAAAEVVQGMLGENRTETEKLLQVRRRLERGEAVSLPDVEDPGAVGLAARRRVLQAAEEELAGLRARLAALEEEARFRNAARAAREGGGGEASEEGPVAGAEAGGGKTGTGTSPAAEAGTAAGEGEAAAGAAPETGLVADRTALALSYYRAGRYEEALAAFRSIDPAARPEGAWVLYMIGRTLERLGRLDEADGAYGQVGLQFPKSAWVKEAEFARKVVAWKKEMGAIEGVPAEAARFLRPGSGAEEGDRSGGDRAAAPSRGKGG